MVIFSYFFEAGVGLALGLSLGFLPALLIIRWLIKKDKETVVISRQPRQSKVVANS